TLLCLTLLMNVNRFWKVPRESAKLSSMTFLCGWLAFVGAIVTIYIATGEWRVPQHMSNSTWSLLTNVLLVLAVMIPAAQFPFHRWLIESVT
ncbi:proton-conducting transporter membrane subunit, partial [Staphylococcus aureus]